MRIWTPRERINMGYYGGIGGINGGVGTRHGDDLWPVRKRRASPAPTRPRRFGHVRRGRRRRLVRGGWASRLVLLGKLTAVVLAAAIVVLLFFALAFYG